MTSKLEHALRKLLRDTETGLTINELAERTGHRGTSVRRCVDNMPDTYIAAWREQYRVRPTALYRAAIVPPDAPEPPKKVVSIIKNKARDSRPKAAKVGRPRKVVEPKFKPQGLTQIRGPWPVWETKK